MTTTGQEKNRIMVPEPTLQRIPVYLQLLKRRFDNEGIYVSSSEIAELLDLKPIQVRKDLEYTNADGRPKLGYNARDLIKSIEKFLGYDNISDAFLVGCGNMGRALLGYSGFDSTGIKIRAAFDTNLNIIGTQVNGHKVFDVSKFSDLAKRLNVRIAILTVPFDKAQETADMMCEAGIKAIWNFAPVHLKVPDDVIVQNENMAVSLSVLVKKLDDSMKG
ncbi:MAG TPA: redox-sensing transcriptional repressor Rex [Clostridia bacterium]|nr:redox-sensing transcriptional repressor Rex [Clostridia bacterium]HPQ47956.1 redox-sensing transcriptional repressor Rex [Clostridia bacterium]HRX41787.1 redox-sensing transcriptional repressor Rex [Clostridia bacterium]